VSLDPDRRPCVTVAAMSAWRALLVITAVAIAPGCSLLLSTDGLRSAGGDAEVLDSSADAGVDFSVSSDGPGLPFCASLSSRPKFCADFDTGLLTDLGGVVGNMVLDTPRATSPPRSLLAVVETGASPPVAELYHAFADTPSSFDASFDIYIDEHDATHDFELTAVELKQTPQKGCGVRVAARQNTWTLDEFCFDNGTTTLSVVHTTSVSLVPARWTHIDFSASFSPTRAFTFAIDGVKAFSAVPLQPGLTSGVATLLVGIYFLPSGATRAKAHIDNVRFDYP
jgi:hypothetical protein